MRWFLHPNFQDKDRLKELLTQYFIELDQDVKHSSLKYASNLSQAGFYKRSTLSYYWHGLGFYEYIKKIVKNFNTELPKLIEKLNTLKNKLLHFNDVDIVLSCDNKDFDELNKNKFFPLNNLRSKEFHPFEANFETMDVESVAKTTPTAVFFTSKAIKTVPFKT